MKKEDKREMEERAGRERDEIAAAREEEEYEVTRYGSTRTVCRRYFISLRFAKR